MARPLVVEGEAVAVMADLDQPAFEVAPAPAARRVCVGAGAPAHRRATAGSATAGAWRPSGSAPDAAARDAGRVRRSASMSLAARRRCSCRHRVGDMPAIGQDLADARPGDHAALRPRMTRADRFVVGIEEILVGGIERHGSPARAGRSTKVSKNHVVCARCHLVGLASGIDWTVWSSGRQRLGELLGTGGGPSRNRSTSGRACVRHATRYQFRHDTSASVG